MIHWPAFDLHYSFSGFLVGALVGITGVGGGSLMTPLLVLLFGVQPAVAVGTDLLYAAITKSVGVFVHGAQKAIKWEIVGLLAVGSLPSTGLSLFLIEHFGKSAELSHAITLGLGLTLFVTAALLLARPFIQTLVGKRREKASVNTEVKAPFFRVFLTILTGVILGAFVSLSSVGGGALGVTAIILLYPLLPIEKVVGSDIAHAVPLTFLAGAGYFFLGLVDQHILFSLLIGSIPGILGGSLIAPRLPENVVRLSLAAVLVAVGAKIFLQR